MAAPGYFILQTDDGSVATVHESQVKKTDSGLPRGRPYPRARMGPEDKKIFVEGVKRYLVYVTVLEEVAKEHGIIVDLVAFVINLTRAC